MSGQLLNPPAPPEQRKTVFDPRTIMLGLTGDSLGKATALAARTACQAIDKALKRHLERGGGDTVEMLDGLHIDPMGDIRDGRS